MINTFRSLSLIVVVFIHAHVYLISYSALIPANWLVTFYDYFLSCFHPASILAAISGYLYFKDQKGDRLLNEKYIRRMRSILVPYLFWLTLFFVLNNALIYFNEHLHANVFINRYQGFSFRMYLMSFFYPELALAKHLWYLNNMFFAFMLSPLLMLFNRNKTAMALLFSGTLLYYYVIFRMDFSNSDQVLKYRFIIFYMMGAFLALNKNLFALALNRKMMITVACLVLYVAIMILYFIFRDTALWYMVNSITIPVAIFLGAYWLMGNYSTFRDTMYNRSKHFLLYIIHPVLLSVFCKLFFYQGLTIPDNYALFLLVVLICSFLVIKTNALIYWLMHRYFPALSRIVL
jgi:hypothetical protein